jgi:hypothetical protein
MENTREKTRSILRWRAGPRSIIEALRAATQVLGPGLSFRRAEIVAPVPLGVGCQNSITPLTLEFAGACRSSHLTSYPDAVERVGCQNLDRLIDQRQFKQARVALRTR